MCIEEREAREDLRDHAPKPSVRERAAALLLIASGIPPAVAARDRVLRPRHPETVDRWLNRWDAEGIERLPIRDGRGRKPAFSP
ncbi:helix-turn-helix domain-containing protein [Roseiflexus sp.]